MMKKFKRVFIEITNTCNLSCSFCYAAKRPPAFMNKELFEKIIDQSVPWVEEAVFHILGEPLLHPQLPTFIDYAKAAGLSVMLTTNGTLLTDELAAVLADKKIRQINISLHAIEQVADQAGYLKNILSFVTELQKKNPDIYINLRLWNILSETNTGIIDVLNSYFGTKLVLPERLEQFKDDKSHRLLDRIYLHLDTRFEWPDLVKPILAQHGTCYGLDSHFGVLVDGTVVPCCLDGDGVIALGSIVNNELNDILKSPRVQTIAKGFKQGSLKEELCKRCGYRARFKKSTYSKFTERKI